MLSTTSQYALRALAFIASRYESGAVLGRTIAAETGIPSNYLSKILVGLNNAGIVNAVRGTGGGYTLTAPPKSITLDQIISVFDRDVVNPSCLLGYSRPCSDENACSAHFVWKEARQCLVSFLHGTSLAEIAEGRQGEAAGKNRNAKKPAKAARSR